MKKTFIHDIVTDVKYLYPCIASAEVISENELVLETETKLSSMYPVKKAVKGMINMGEDYWGRTLFRDEKGHYFCDVDGTLYFKGSDPEGEPHWRVEKEIVMEIPQAGNALEDFKTYIEMFKIFLRDKRTGLKIERVKASIIKDKYDPYNELSNKVLCQYLLKVQ